MPNTTKIFQDRMFFLILTFRKKLTFCDKQQSLVDIIYTIELTLRAVLHLIHEGRVLHQIRRVSIIMSILTPLAYIIYTNSMKISILRSMAIQLEMLGLQVQHLNHYANIEQFFFSFAKEDTIIMDLIFFSSKCEDSHKT